MARAVFCRLEWPGDDHFDNAYYLPSVSMAGYCVKPIPSRIPFRGFAATGCFCVKPLSTISPASWARTCWKFGTAIRRTRHYGQTVNDNVIRLVDRLGQAPTMPNQEIDKSIDSEVLRRGLMTP